MKNVHEYSVDRATNSARLGATNPTRKYIRGPVDENPPIIVQLAKGDVQFYDQGGQPLDVSEVPEDVLAALRKNPIRRGNETVEQVLRFCEFCPGGDKNPDNAIASGDYERHLIERHIRQQATSARRVEPEEADEPEVQAAPAPAPKRAARKKTTKKAARKRARK
jgi:hypothetical protein